MCALAFSAFALLMSKVEGREGEREGVLYLFRRGLYLLTLFTPIADCYRKGDVQGGVANVSNFSRS